LSEESKIYEKVDKNPVFNLNDEKKLTDRNQKKDGDDDNLNDLLGDISGLVYPVYNETWLTPI